METLFAVIKFTQEGTHRYPEAKGVHEYLRYPHRHLFHITVHVQQFHNNRDIEYLAAKDRLKSSLYESYPIDASSGIMNFDTDSCESIAFTILDILRTILKGSGTRRVKISVFEDGENGCELNSTVYGGID